VMLRRASVLSATPTSCSSDLHSNYSRDLRQAKLGSGIILHGSNPEPLMSALGQKQTSRHIGLMSALPPKADIARWI
jgi:hypothetical protein